MKPIGLTMIMIACTLGGILIYHERKCRVDALSAALRLTELVLFELEYKQADTASIMRNIGDRHFPYFDEEKRIFQYLIEEENEQISTLFATLGKSDIDSQLTLFRGMKEDFSKRLEEREAAFQTHKRLYLGAGILSGAFLCLLML